jgi:hypothetical protein
MSGHSSKARSTATTHPAPLKNPANSDVKPLTPKNHHPKIHKQLEINYLQAKNKSAKTGILVSLNSLELKLDRKQKTRSGKSRAFAVNRKVRRGKSRLNPFPPKALHQKLPVGYGWYTSPRAIKGGPKYVAENTT